MVDSQALGTGFQGHVLRIEPGWVDDAQGVETGAGRAEGPRESYRYRCGSMWDDGGDGEPAGWSRPASSGVPPGREQVEEGRDSTGQGAG